MAKAPSALKRIVEKKAYQARLTSELHDRLSRVTERCKEEGFELDVDDVVERALEKAVVQAERYLESVKPSLE